MARTAKSRWPEGHRVTHLHAGDGAGAGAGVETRERTQDANGDKSGYGVET